MSLEKSKAIVLRVIEASKKQSPALLDELMAPDFVDHTTQLQGRVSLKQVYTVNRKGFPDFHVTLEDH